MPAYLYTYSDDQLDGGSEFDYMENTKVDQIVDVTVSFDTYTYLIDEKWLKNWAATNDTSIDRLEEEVADSEEGRELQDKLMEELDAIWNAGVKERNDANK